VERLVISEEVRGLLPAAALERVIAHGQHTDLVCADCGGRTAPEDGVPMSVVLRVGAAEQTVVQYTHTDCSPSRVDSKPVAQPAQHRLLYVAMLRDHQVASVLVWERTAVSVDLAQGEDLGVAWYREQGFQASEAGIATTTGPLLTNVTLGVRGRDLVLESAPEHRALEQFDDVVSTAPPGWLDAVRVGAAACWSSGRRSGSIAPPWPASTRCSRGAAPSPRS
jgi:hypothetical protein